METLTRSRYATALSTNSQKISNQRTWLVFAAFNCVPSLLRSVRPETPANFLNDARLQRLHKLRGHNFFLARLQHEGVHRKGFTMFPGGKHNRGLTLAQCLADFTRRH